MWTYKSPLDPDDSDEEAMEFVRDEVRQLYNHTRHLYTNAPDGEKPTYTSEWATRVEGEWLLVSAQ